MKKEKQKEQETTEEVDLCEKCGSKLAEEDGVKFCPNCDAKVDFFGDEDE